MKIIFICTKSITFNTFLKSQADYFIKRGSEVVVACSDSEKLNFKNNLSYKINFPNNIKIITNFDLCLIPVPKFPTPIPNTKI